MLSPAARHRFFKLLRGFAAAWQAFAAAFCKSLRRRSKHINVKETAPQNCYAICRKEQDGSIRLAAFPNHYFISHEEECIVMLYTIIALAVIFANMYLTSKLTFTCRPDTPDYDYR